MRKNIVESVRLQMTIWRMCNACLIPKAINTHSEYVIRVACLIQLRSCERGCMLRHTYTTCLVFCFLHSLFSTAVTKCNQQPDLRFSIDRSMPAAEQRTVLPTAQWVVSFIREVWISPHPLWLEQGCTRFPKKKEKKL